MRRVEDPRLLRGEGCYVEDITLPGMLHLAFLRSPYPHAKVRGLDVRDAEAMEGVSAILKGEDLLERIKAPLPAGLPSGHRGAPPHYPIAYGTIKHQGEIIACAIARSRGVALDALEEIEVDYEPLKPITSIEEALKGRALVHEGLGSNVAYHRYWGDPSLEDALSSSPFRLKERLKCSRVAGFTLEPRGVVASYERDRLTLWSSTQIPHALRGELARILGLSEESIRVIAPEVGGGFGAKLNIYPEEVLVALASMMLKRPIKWIEARSESFLATTHARDQVHEVEVGFDSKGRILALKDTIYADIGAYDQWGTELVPTLTARMMQGPYSIAKWGVELYCVYTNKTPTDAYRGAGRPEATFVLERTLDLIARKLRLDPAEVRLRNLIKGEGPYRSKGGYTYDSRSYVKAFKKALKLMGYERLREEQARLRLKGGSRRLGIGLSSYVEICGIGPSLGEEAFVRLEPSGKIVAGLGTASQGQGHATAFTKLVSKELGLPPSRIQVIYGDTGLVSRGLGTFGSRSLPVGGMALKRACHELVKRLRALAANELGCAPKEVRYSEGLFMIAKGKDAVKGRSISLKELAKAHYSKSSEPLEVRASFDPKNYTFPFGTHVALVEVDLEDGTVRILRYLCVDDVGRAIDAKLVEGQVQGGIAQGIAQALHERLLYSPDGNLLNANLVEYWVPSALEIPKMECHRTITPSPSNSLGAKGVGEIGTIASIPAVINAIEDALMPSSARITEIPVTKESIWRLANP